MQEMPSRDDRLGVNAEPSDNGSAKNTDQITPDVKMTRLAESFRCLEYKPGIRPWDAAALVEWVRSGAAIPAEAQAAAFVLEVANMSMVWDGVPSFKVRDATTVWSEEDRAAFAAWTQEPWYL